MGMLNVEDGGAVGAEDWEVILGYDQEIRRSMIHRMLEGESLPAALRKAWNCSLVKDRFFVTALQKRSFKSNRSGGHSSHGEPPKKLSRRETRQAGTSGGGVFIFQGKGQGQKEQQGLGIIIDVRRRLARWTEGVLPVQQEGWEVRSRRLPLRAHLWRVLQGRGPDVPVQPQEHGPVKVRVGRRGIGPPATRRSERV